MTVSLVGSSSNAAYAAQQTEIEDASKSNKPRKIRKPKGSLAVIKNIAVTALAVQGAAMAPKAEGGPLAEILCLAACTAAGMANPAFVPMVPTCLASCTLFGVAPTP